MVWVWLGGLGGGGGGGVVFGGGWLWLGVGRVGCGVGLRWCSEGRCVFGVVGGSGFERKGFGVRRGGSYCSLFF